MGKANVTQFLRGAQVLVSKRSPEILTGLGIAGMITTTVLAVRATPKAIVLIDKEIAKQNHKLIREAGEKGEMSCNQISKLKPLDAVKVAWKPYIPAVVTGVASVACLVGASSVNARRNAALYSAYKLSETALTEYKEKVLETIGEKKEQAVRDKIAKDKIEKTPVSKNEVVITDRGSTLCFDTISGRYFKSDIESIKKAENDLNKTMLQGMFGYITLNEFYDEIGLDHIELGDELGWNLDHGMIDIGFSSQLTDKGEPSVVLDYRVAPRYDYSKY